MLTSTLVALALVAFAGSPTPASPDPYQIYERCVVAMANTPEPPFEFYQLHVAANRIDITRGYSSAGTPTTTLHFGNPRERATYRVWVRNSDQRSFMQDIASRAASVTPPVPWQLDFHVPASDDGRQPRETVASHAVTVNQATKLLSEVEVDHRSNYQITFGGMEQYEHHAAYRLLLQSVTGDPNDHPLRELVVDATSFRAWQVVAQVGQGGWLFGGGLVLTANFEPVGGYWVSTSGSVDGSGHYAFFHLDGTYSYLASDFSFPSALPKSYFETDPN
jgi:hypothetical protein